MRSLHGIGWAIMALAAAVALTERVRATEPGKSVRSKAMRVDAAGANVGEEFTPRGFLERETRIRAGSTMRIISVRTNPHADSFLRTDGITASAGSGLPHPRPRLAGFSPRVAITTSDKKRGQFDESPWEHQLEGSYVGNPLNAPASQNFVIGYLDSGADVDLAAGEFAQILGLTGTRLTTNVIEFAGVGGSAFGTVTHPVAFFVAGLSAVESETLNLSAIVGHSNVAGVVTPQLNCATGEVISAIMGNSFLSFHNSLIRVDTPRKVMFEGEEIQGPDVTIYPETAFIPDEVYDLFTRAFSIQFGGLAPATTASFFPDFEDLTTPLTPTLMALAAGFFPSGGAYFTSVQFLQGEPSPINPVQTFRLLVDTGAQASVINPALAAQLSLPFEPDFVVDVCGLGGTAFDVPGYYVDLVRINAFGGALEYSQSPFIVLDLPSPEGGGLAGLLGMNFFWDRNVMFEPSLLGSGFFNVSDPLPFAFADNDVDWDVDLVDMVTVASCLAGPNQVANPECMHFDANENMTADLLDFARAANCMSGSNMQAEAFCGYE
jgi:hypothetical protein